MKQSEQGAFPAVDTVSPLDQGTDSGGHVLQRVREGSRRGKGIR